MDRELRDRLAGVIEHDLEHAAAGEIGRAINPLIERAEGVRERALIARLEDALGTGGTAAAGLDEVLSLLQDQRVEMLLLADRANLTAGLCTRCGQLSASGDSSCRIDGAPLRSVDATEHIIALAAKRGVGVVVLRHEPDALRKHGQIAALLRW